MNFIFGFAGGAISSYFYQSNPISKIGDYFQYPKRIIDAREEPFLNASIIAFLSKKVSEDNPYTVKKYINLFGNFELKNVPVKGLIYREYYYGLLTYFGIQLISGEEPDGFVWEIYGSYFEQRLDEISKIFQSCFFKPNNYIISLPGYKYDCDWMFNPTFIPYKTSKKNEEIIDFVLTNKCHGILLIGPKNSGKTLIAGKISNRMKSPMYVANNYLKPVDFFDSIRSIPPNSILLIKDIDEVFMVGFHHDKINKDTIIGIFDFINENVIVIFTSSNLEAYESIPFIFGPNRIKQKFIFYKKSMYNYVK